MNRARPTARVGIAGVKTQPALQHRRQPRNLGVAVLAVVQVDAVDQLGHCLMRRRVQFEGREHCLEGAQAARMAERAAVDVKGHIVRGRSGAIDDLRRRIDEAADEPGGGEPVDVGQGRVAQRRP